MPGVRLKPRCYLDGNGLRRAVLFSGATTSSGRFFGCDCEFGKIFRLRLRNREAFFNCACEAGNVIGKGKSVAVKNMEKWTVWKEEAAGGRNHKFVRKELNYILTKNGQILYNISIFVRDICRILGKLLK